MSEQTKHTPGPWYAARNFAFWEVVPAHAGENGTPYSVADTCCSQPGNADGGLQEANATLIAAAPELLSFAKRFVAGVEAHADAALKERLSYHIGNARAAIAKAEGVAE